jgi:hypothetical protein
VNLKVVFGKIQKLLKERRIASLKKERYQLRCEFRNIPKWDISHICWVDQKREERRVAKQIININKELEELGYLEDEVDKFHGINWDSETGEMIK